VIFPNDIHSSLDPCYKTLLDKFFNIELAEPETPFPAVFTQIHIDQPALISPFVNRALVDAEQVSDLSDGQQCPVFLSFKFSYFSKSDFSFGLRKPCLRLYSHRYPREVLPKHGFDDQRLEHGSSIPRSSSHFSITQEFGTLSKN